MCHNSGVQSAQIDRFVENGMPQKIVKTVQYTIRKRVAEEQLKFNKIKAAADAAAIAAATAEEEEDDDLVQYNISSSRTTADLLIKRAPDLDATNHLKLSPLGGGGGGGVVGGGCPFRHLREKKQSITNITDISGANAHELLEPINHMNNNNNNNVYSEDVLAKGTLWTKKIAERLNQQVEQLQSSKIYTLLTKTTQPAHLIAICVLSLILLTVWPEIIQNASSSSTAKTEQQNYYSEQQQQQQQQQSFNKGHHQQHHPMAVLAYLGAFATHFGAQIWMTFVSGLSLYFALPRHTFGQCQQILFPKYFALNSVLSLSMFLIFVKFLLRNWCLAECVQLSTLALTTIIEVIVRLYLAPPMLRLMHEKYRIEEAVGSGQEIGGLVQGDLVQCPHYQRIHKTFRRIHMTIAIGNIVILLCTCLHLYYLASKISFQ